MNLHRAPSDGTAEGRPGLSTLGSSPVVADNDLLVVSKNRDRLPPGRQPYDRLVGLRVGAVAGGLLGGVVGAVMGTPWLLVAGAVIGAAVGYMTERRKVRNEAQQLHDGGPGSGSKTDDPA